MFNKLQHCIGRQHTQYTSVAPTSLCCPHSLPENVSGLAHVSSGRPWLLVAPERVQLTAHYLQASGVKNTPHSSRVLFWGYKPRRENLHQYNTRRAKHCLATKTAKAFHYSRFYLLSQFTLFLSHLFYSSIQIIPTECCNLLCISSNRIIPFSAKHCYNSQHLKRRPVLSLYISVCVRTTYLKMADLDSRKK